MRRCSLIGFFTITTLTIYCQSVEEVYSEWLLSTPIGSVVGVEKYDGRTANLQLSVKKSFTSATEIKQVYLTWDSLENAYRRYNMELSELLLYQLQIASRRPLDHLSIKITSAIPILFSVTIDVEDGQVKSDVEYIEVRGNELSSMPLDGFFHPANVVPLDFSVSEARKVVYEEVVRFFKVQFDVDQNDISHSVSGTVGERYQIDKKSMFSDQMNGRVVVSITYVEVNDDKTEIILELIAYAARGIIKPGEYRPIDDSKLLIKVSAIQINLANQLYASAKK